MRGLTALLTIAAVVTGSSCVATAQPAVAGGGGPSDIARLAFDGTSYPRNPTVPPAIPVEQGGVVLIAAEPALTAIGSS
jgi:hypothetical protein